jgi:hypothetical protein
MTGLQLDEMLRALSVLASGPGLVGNHARELNPHNAAADSGLLERFAGSFADAIRCGITAPDVRDHDHEDHGDA